MGMTIRWMRPKGEKKEKSGKIIWKKGWGNKKRKE